MKTFIISDTHFNHANIATYCDRPANFTQLLVERWNRTVKSDDLIIHLGDVAIGDKKSIRDIMDSLSGKKILVRGNHDRGKSNVWWMTKGGFDFACDSMIFRGCWLTHEPADVLPQGYILNLHGHLHNIWHGFHPNASVDPLEEQNMQSAKCLKWPWQRLFAVEYTDYTPVEFEKFTTHPNKYFAKGIPNVGLEETNV